MKFLLDENISETVTRRLQDAGFSVLHILDVGLTGMDDDTILVYARRRKLIIITHDKDFGNIIRYPIRRHCGVILVRLKNQAPQNTAPCLIKFLRKHEDIQNCLVILREEAARIIRIGK